LLLGLLSLKRVVLLRAAWATALGPQIRVGSREHDAKKTKKCKGKMVLDRKCDTALADRCGRLDQHAWLEAMTKLWPHKVREVRL
jgi:hypothetical protein